MVNISLYLVTQLIKKHTMKLPEKSKQERKVAILNRIMKEDDVSLISDIENLINKFDHPPAQEERTMKLSAFLDKNLGRTKAVGFLYDNTYLECGSWKEIYEEIIRILINTGTVTPSMLPIEDCHRGKRYMINTHPIHKSEKAFTIPAQIEDIYAECHYNASTLMKNVYQIIIKSKTLEVDHFQVRFIK